VNRIQVAFADRLDKPLDDPQWPWIVEKWRSQRLKAGIADGTVNRELAALKSAMAKAVQWKLINANPLAAVKLRKVDNARVRYLEPEEERRLRAALVKRDRDAIAGRKRGNQWRAERGRELLPALPAGDYFDHLTPMVLTALNTGLRRGELTALTWQDINLPGKRLTVRAAAAKGGKSRHVPLNREAVDVLTRWQGQRSGEGVLFNVRDVKTAWLALMKDAAIEGFNFHDLRHTFASNLVMARADLNTVRELLGHADMTMTLRYAHLAPEHKQATVDLLSRRSR
jgi:integrase